VGNIRDWVRTIRCHIVCIIKNLYALYNVYLSYDVVHTVVLYMLHTVLMHCTLCTHTMHIHIHCMYVVWVCAVLNILAAVDVVLIECKLMQICQSADPIIKHSWCDYHTTFCIAVLWYISMRWQFFMFVCMSMKCWCCATDWTAVFVKYYSKIKHFLFTHLFIPDLKCSHSGYSIFDLYDVV